MNKAREEACASATESTPAVEEALFFWTKTNDEARLTALLERGIANIEARDRKERTWGKHRSELSERTVLHIAAEMGHPGCLEALIKAGSNLMAPTEDNSTAMDLAERGTKPPRRGGRKKGGRTR